jgi:methionyl aminopeptidase
MAKGVITLKSEAEIDAIRESSLLVSKTLGEVKKWVEPGVSTLKLDKIAEAFIRDHGGRPAFKDYLPDFADTPFPFSLCVSINQEVVHGFSSDDRVLEDGDIVSIDCGVEMNGFFGDSAYTFPVGNISAKKQRLLDVTKSSLYKGLEKAVDGNRLGEVSNAIQRHVELYGFSIVKEMVGHGLGRNLHEPPEVPNYGKRRSGPKLKSGMVLAVEPMVNLGRGDIDVAEDGWTVFAKDLSASAHFEHSIVIRNGKAEQLSTFDFIEN